MRQIIFSLVAAGALAVTLAGCKSAEPRNYTLEPVAGAIVSVPPHVIEVRRPGLAGYLDRAAIVVRAHGYEVSVDSTIRWAEPFGDMIGRVLAEDLSQRLRGSSVFAEGGAISADAELRVELDVRRFDDGGDGTLHLLAELAVERRHLALVNRHLDLQCDMPAGGAAAQAACMSTLVGQVADQVARDVADIR